MLQKRKMVLFSVSLLVTVIFFFLLPRIVDQNVNSILPPPTDQNLLETPALHKTLFISDLHADTLLWERPLLKASSWGHVDLPRLQKGHVALQAFSVVTKTPFFPNVEKNPVSDAGTFALSLSQRWPIKTWTKLSERALYQAAKLKKAISESQGALRLILSHEDLMRYREDWEKNPHLVAAWLTIEGAHALDGDLSLLDILYQEGFRMIGPAHLFDNEWTGSQSGEKKYGLTELGKKWVLEMNRKKMIIDLAHLSPKAMEEVLDLSKRPSLVSHTGIQKVCNIPRNLTDAQIKKIAAKGGLIAVGLWKEVLCGEDINIVAESIRHICDIVGCKFVAIGSDWDGFVPTVVDAENLVRLTATLIKHGFNDHEIKGIMGENTFRFLLENLP